MNANTTNHPACCGCSDCEDALARPTVKPFKSARAAKMAYTKVRHAYDAKRSEGFAASSEIHRQMREVGSMASEEYRTLKATEERCKVEEAALFDMMRAIYEQAERQDFYINSWHFGHNPTRDLIAANMD